MLKKRQRHPSANPSSRGGKRLRPHGHPDVAADSCHGSNSKWQSKETAWINITPHGDNLTVSQNLAHCRLTRLKEENWSQAIAPYTGPDGMLASQEDQSDFESFFERYLIFLSKQPPAYGLPPQDPVAPYACLTHAADTTSHAFRVNMTAAQRAASALPREHDDRFQHNFAIATESATYGSNIAPLDASLIRTLLQHYQAFLQRKALQALQKLRTASTNLPIVNARQRIVDAVQRHPVVLIAGATGCGKSTQVPQFLLEAGFRGIAVTQPRRLAAVSLARHVAQERLESSASSSVGYQIRFDSTRRKSTKILYVTEGLLLRQMEVDVQASCFDVVVLDEVHERHLAADLLLGVLRDTMLHHRKELKLVLMSATPQMDVFSRYFGLNAVAMVEVPGRCFTVATEHIELPGEPLSIRSDVIRRPKQRSGFDCQPYLDLLRRIEGQFDKEERGDVLIFVPGTYEIEALVQAVREFAERTKHWVALPLHSQLSMEQQDQVFDAAPQGVRKVIVATNIAETSLTIEGVRFVVDSGKMRGMDVDAFSSVRLLAEQWISQASAEQRRGRAGRTGPGRCFRLYSERLFGEFEPFMAPEIHRSALERTLLQILALGIELHQFRFPEAPRQEAVGVALKRLVLMRAAVLVDGVHMTAAEADRIDNEAFCAEGTGCVAAGGWAAGFTSTSIHQLLQVLRLLRLPKSVSNMPPRQHLALTPLGRVLSRLPVDVSVGKMLLLALVFGVQSHAVVLAGALGLHSPRVQKHGEQPQGRWTLDHRLGDPFTTLRVYQTWLHERSRHKGGNDVQSRRWAREQAVDERVLLELNKLNIQLCDLLRESICCVDGSGMGLGALLRKDKMARLEATITGGHIGHFGAAGREAVGSDIIPEERLQLEAELEELKQREHLRQRRRLLLEEGEGALVADESGLGYSCEHRTLGGYDSDGDLANASGGEGKVNRDLNRRRRPGRRPHCDNVKTPRNSAFTDKLRRRNLEFDLRYGAHSHTQRVQEPLSAQQEELLQLVVACALYPNLSLPNSNNRQRCSAECVFHTRQVPFANLHPSSSLYADLPTTLKSWEGLAFGAVLQTRLPFMTHVTRCPAVPVALLSAGVVDATNDCRMLICDEWLQLIFEDPEEAMCLLEDTYVLRRAVSLALDEQLVEVFNADCDDDVPEKLAEPELSAASLLGAPLRLQHFLAKQPRHLRGAVLAELALVFWRRRSSCRWQCLSPNEYAAFVAASASANNAKPKVDASKDGNSCGTASSANACAPANDHAPGIGSVGLHSGVGGWLHFGRVSEAGVRPEDTLISDHLAIPWPCPRCQVTFRFTRIQIAEHRTTCFGAHELSGNTKSPDSTSAETSTHMGSTTALQTGGWCCDICGLLLPAQHTTRDVLQHRRSHGL